MSKPNRIFIVGHSGAGKGVLAQALAQKLNWKFIDADFGLSASIGRSLPDILGTEGEASFLTCLNTILSEQIKQDNIIVTTDGSIVCHEQNCALLASEFTVSVDVSPAVQLERISHNRPLLPSVDYQAFLNSLREERDALYTQVASLSVNTDNGDIEEHVSSVLSAFDTP
jgi:shikimate kinase